MPRSVIICGRILGLRGEWARQACSKRFDFRDAAAGMRPAMEDRVGGMLQGLEQLGGVAFLQHELLHAAGVAAETLGVALVESGLADDARQSGRRGGLATIQNEETVGQ